MRKTISAYIVKCDSCAHRKLEAPFGTLAKDSTPFEVCAMDFVGAYPLSHSRNEYLRFFVDQFTKYAELFTVADQTAACAKVFVMRIIARHGTPKFVISDSGSQFLSELFTETCKLLKVGRICTSGYHPQNNMVKRLHRTLHDTISHILTVQV
jgi:transposase InsO family protein